MLWNKNYVQFFINIYIKGITFKFLSMSIFCIYGFQEKYNKWSSCSNEDLKSYWYAAYAVGAFEPRTADQYWISN